MIAAEPDACTPDASGRDQGAERKRGKGCKRVAIFCEPSPISHVSGMKERFSCLIKGLKAAGDDVLLVTPDSSSQPPKEYLGAKVLNVLGFPLPLYESPTLLLSSGLSVRVFWHLVRNRPDVIHVTTPGLLVFAATLYSRLLNIPLVMSYHTHIPDYIPKYTWRGLVSPMWRIIQWCTHAADLTLVPSNAMKDEMVQHQCKHKNMEVWQRAVDTQRFNPRFRSLEMRYAMSEGHPEAPLLVYVGRLGAEKNLTSIRHILAANPTARLAFVGDGPARPDLEAHFDGLPVKFMGMMKGEALSQAYASADIFVMPSMTETLGFVVLEAMASGLAVVSVASLGLIDIVSKPGVNGFLYPPGDYDLAARQVRTLIEQPELQHAVAAAARAEAESLSWQAAVHKIRTKQYARAIRMFNRKRRAAVRDLNRRMATAMAMVHSPMKALTRFWANTYRFITPAAPKVKVA